MVVVGNQTTHTLGPQSRSQWRLIWSLNTPIFQILLFLITVPFHEPGFLDWGCLGTGRLAGCREHKLHPTHHDRLPHTVGAGSGCSRPYSKSPQMLAVASDKFVTWLYNRSFPSHSDCERRGPLGPTFVLSRPLISSQFDVSPLPFALPTPLSFLFSPIQLLQQSNSQTTTHCQNAVYSWHRGVYFHQARLQAYSRVSSSR